LALLRFANLPFLPLQTDADPHNATRGFFFAHVGWLLIKKHPDIVAAGKKLTFDDLANDSTVTFQKVADPWFALFMCFVFPGLVCTLWGDSFWNGYWVAGSLRYVFLLHCTWLVNSAAHLYGEHPYDPKSWPAENPLVAFASMGEGWHNWHHKYPFDYSASEFGASKQFNPTRMFIDTCVLLGLASDCKTATGAWHKLRVHREKSIYEDGDVDNAAFSEKAKAM
jgi:stearoyl-CoA desaturase (delta-9 desaturase)